MMMAGHGAIGLEGEWLFKASLVVLTTKLVSVSCFFFRYLRKGKKKTLTPYRLPRNHLVD